jgi:hypothetical protein
MSQRGGESIIEHYWRPPRNRRVVQDHWQRK